MQNCMDFPHFSKGVLLGCRRSPFRWQKESFWSVKGVLLECKRTTFRFDGILMLTLTDFTLHFSCCFTKLLHSHFIPLLNNFTC